MNDGYKIRDQSKPHFLTFTVVDWVDVFTRKIYSEIILDSIRYCQNEKGMVLFGYVIMSNHIHCIVQSENGMLSDLIRDFKKFTSKKILTEILNGPESRKKWMIEIFEMQPPNIVEIQNTNFGNMATIQKKFILKSFYGLS